MHNSIVSLSHELKQALLDIEAHCPIEYDGRALESLAAEIFQRAANTNDLTGYYTIPPEGYTNKESADITCIHYGWFFPTRVSPQRPELHIYFWRYQSSDGCERYTNRVNPCELKK